jgi:hypothetical protein
MKIKDFKSVYPARIRTVQEGKEETVLEFLTITKLRQAAEQLFGDKLIDAQDLEIIKSRFGLIEEQAAKCITFSDTDDYYAFFSFYWELYED